MTEARTDTRKPGEMKLGHGRLSAAAVASALELQRTIADATGRWLRVGEVLLLRGDLSTESAAELRGTALFPMQGSSLPEAELYGEIALRKNLIKPDEFVECLDLQAGERRERRAHRLIGTLLVERGYMKPAQLEACEEDFRRDLRLHQDEAKRATEAAEQKAKPVLTPIDAQYVRAARAGELPTEEIVSALGVWRKLQTHLDRKVALWEYLVVRGIVTIDVHKRMLEKSCNVKTANFGSWMLGGIIVELGYASTEDVASALEQRTADGMKAKRLGDILIERKVVTPAEIEEALRIQAERRRRSSPPSALARVRSKVGRRSAIAAAALVLVFAAGFGVGSVRTSLAYRTLSDGAAPLAMRLAALERVAARDARAADAALTAVARKRESPAELRAACLVRLEESTLPEAREAISAALHDESARVRMAACWAIAERRERVEEPALRTCLHDRDPALALAAARALALLSESDGRAELVAALEPGHLERRRLAEALSIPEARLGRAIPAALEALSGFRFGERLELWHAWLALQPAADAVLGKHRGADTAARYARLLDSPKIASRFTAARGLAHLGDARGARLLVRALGRDEALRAALKQERDIDLDRLAPEIAAVLELITGEKHGTDAAAWTQALDHLEQRAEGTAP